LTSQAHSLLAVYHKSHRLVLAW